MTSRIALRPARHRHQDIEAWASSRAGQVSALARRAVFEFPSAHLQFPRSAPGSAGRDQRGDGPAPSICTKLSSRFHESGISREKRERGAALSGGRMGCRRSVELNPASCLAREISPYSWDRSIPLPSDRTPQPGSNSIRWCCVKKTL
jgi:hypothetical protein